MVLLVFLNEQLESLKTNLCAFSNSPAAGAQPLVKGKTGIVNLALQLCSI